MTYLTAIPAYGRDYKSKAAVIADWEAGKDFLAIDGLHESYINKDDKPSDVKLSVRYSNLRKVTVIS